MRFADSYAPGSPQRRKTRWWGKREVGHTLEFSRMAQRPPATDFSGGKASEVSFTAQRNNLTVIDVVFQFNPLSSAVALSSTLSLSRRTSGTWLGTVEVSTSSEEAVRGANRDHHTDVPSFLLPFAGTGSGPSCCRGLSVKQAHRTTLLAPSPSFPPART